MTNAYEEAYRRSIEDPEGFWGEAAEAITWTKKWDKVLDDSNKPFYRWFARRRAQHLLQCAGRTTSKTAGATSRPDL
jgi:propionyl-CoA synthetase